MACPPGEQATGGGFSGVGSNEHVDASAPTAMDDPNPEESRGWSVSISAFPASADRQFVIYAVCAGPEDPSG